MQTVIEKRVTITKTNFKIEFDLGELPEGEYTLQLVIKPVENSDSPVDFSKWASDFKIPDGFTFSREEIYGDDGR